MMTETRFRKCIFETYKDWTVLDIQRWAQEGDKKFVKIRKEMYEYDRFIRRFEPMEKDYLLRILSENNGNIPFLAWVKANDPSRIKIELFDNGTRGLKMSMTPRCTMQNSRFCFILPPFILNQYWYL